MLTHCAPGSTQHKVEYFVTKVIWSAQDHVITCMRADNEERRGRAHDQR